MIYTFKCKKCHVIKLCDSKKDVQALKDKHWKGNGHNRVHLPVDTTMKIEMRTSKNSGISYPILTAE